VCFGWVWFWLGINDDKVIISALIVIYSFYHAVYRNTCEKPDIQATCETQQNLLIFWICRRNAKANKAKLRSHPNQNAGDLLCASKPKHWVRTRMPEVGLTASKFSLRTWKLLGMCIILVFDNDLPILVCDEDVKPPWAILCNIYFSKCRFDGSSFVKNLEASVADRQKRGKPPRKIRYVHYCQWAHALLVRFVISTSLVLIL
jgi:hypothetical protein